MAAPSEDIITLEHKTWEALKTGGQALIPYLSEDCCMLLPGGTIFDSHSDPSLLDILNRPDMKPWTNYEMDDIRVLSLGPDSAAICYAVEASRGEEIYNALITSVWRKSEAGNWLMVVHQQSPC